MVIDANNGIKPGHNNSTATRANDNAAKEPAARGDSAQHQARPDSVVLSQEAQSMNRLEENIASLPEIDNDKVANIKQAIAEGRFEYDADRIAENMLNQDDLLG